MARRLQVLGVVLMLSLFASVLPLVLSGVRASAAPAQAARVTIAGSVVDASLAPLAGVAVTLERGGRVEARTTTDAAGKFRFVDIAPGDYRVRAERQGLPVVTRDLRISGSAAMVQLPIVLAAPAQDQSKATTPGETARGAATAPAPLPAMPPPTANVASMSERVDTTAGAGRGGGGRGGGVSQALPVMRQQELYYPPSGESYAHVEPGRFQSAREHPLSTFGADVDTASYANVRRFLSSGQLPPSDAVRVEEFVNYFKFGYATPTGNAPIALTTEVGDAPWAPSHKLVLIGARAKAPVEREITGRNIVLLVDVSGSMAPANRLPMIKTALGLFVDTLRPDDRLAIVTYAGASGIALLSTPARRRDVIQNAIAGLGAGGSTNGAQGLITAYRVARESFIPGGVNRVILATDGDFNVGVVNQQDLVRLIERERDSGVFLSVFGVGEGNLKDSTMEMLADKGNGHYAYLDSLQEARRVLLREADATLETVAKDVKFQVEFNPAMVSAWKLIGYENRALAAQDFNNDRKDGGEMGAGHTVTVLYEVIPVGVANVDDDRAPGRPDVDPLRYQAAPPVPPSTLPRRSPEPARQRAQAGEWLTVKVRYKAPEGEVSNLISQPVRSGGRVQHLPFAAAVAEFGLLLRDDTRDTERWDALLRRVGRIQVPALLVADKDGFAELVATARGLARLR